MILFNFLWLLGHKRYVLSMVIMALSGCFKCDSVNQCYFVISIIRDENDNYNKSNVALFEYMYDYDMHC